MRIKEVKNPKNLQTFGLRIDKESIDKLKKYVGETNVSKTIRHLVHSYLFQIENERRDNNFLLNPYIEYDDDENKAYDQYID